MYPKSQSDPLPAKRSHCRSFDQVPTRPRRARVTVTAGVGEERANDMAIIFIPPRTSPAGDHCARPATSPRFPMREGLKANVSCSRHLSGAEGGSERIEQVTESTRSPARVARASFAAFAVPLPAVSAGPTTDSPVRLRIQLEDSHGS
jgi:hypothetical protein